MKTISKTIDFPLDCHSNIKVIISKKRMKNIRLIITQNAEIKLSIPMHITYDYANQFLSRKRDWIKSQLLKIKNNQAKDYCNFCNNGNIFLLGQSYPLKVELSTKNQVLFNNCLPLNNNYPTQNYGFTIYVKDPSVDIKNLFVKWCKKYCLDLFSNRLNYIYSQMFKNNTPPIIKIKSMKSMWGNCNFVKKIITLNLYLAKVNLECIDYVIIHELAHLIHHNHGKEFHKLMTTLLPDWKVRKRALNCYSLQF